MTDTLPQTSPTDTASGADAGVDIKPRSRVVTDGLEATASRGMLRAVGMGDDDWEKPQIGVASSWNEITPCNLSLDRLAKRAKEGVHAAGGYPLEFGTISVSDGISMGHEGMRASLVSREVIADSVETVVQAERLDGTVLLAGCDKTLPGMLMAAARLDLASLSTSEVDAKLMQKIGLGGAQIGVGNVHIISPKGIPFHGGHAPLHGDAGLLGEFIGGFGPGEPAVHINAGLVPAFSAQQLIYGNAQMLAKNIPQGDFDGRKRAHEHRAAPPVSVAIDIVNVALDIQGILPR